MYVSVCAQINIKKKLGSLFKYSRLFNEGDKNISKHVMFISYYHELYFINLRFLKRIKCYLNLKTSNPLSNMRLGL